MQPYLVIDGQRVDFREENAKMGIGATDDDKLNALIASYSIRRDAPERALAVSVRARRRTKTGHYKIDTETFEIIQRAVIESE